MQIMFHVKIKHKFRKLSNISSRDRVSGGTGGHILPIFYDKNNVQCNGINFVVTLNC